MYVGKAGGPRKIKIDLGGYEWHQIKVKYKITKLRFIIVMENKSNIKYWKR